MGNKRTMGIKEALMRFLRRSPLLDAMVDMIIIILRAIFIVH
jgi:hypothetical protein